MRTKNFFRIIYSSAILQIIVVLSGLILPRLIINEYGSEVNGLIVTIKQFITYFSVVGMGIILSSSAALYEPIAHNKKQKINEILSATSSFFKNTGYVMAIFIIIFLISYSYFMKDNIPIYFTTSLIIIIGAGALIEHFSIAKYRVLLIADQKNNIVSINTAQGVIIYTIVSIILIKLHFSIIVLQLVAMIIFLIRLYLLKNYIAKNYSEVRFNLKPNMEVIPGRWTAFVYQLPGLIISSSPVILISLYVGLKEVSIYAIYNMIFSSIAMIVAIFSSGLNASFGNVIALNEKSKLENIFRSYEFVYYSTIFFFYTSALKLSIPFIDLYTEGITDANYTMPILVLLFVLSGLGKNLRAPALTLVEASGLYKQNVINNIWEAVAFLFLGIIGVKFWGMLGVLYALIITSSLRTLLYMYFVKKYIIKDYSIFKLLYKISLNIGIMILILRIPVNLSVENFLDWIIVSIKISSFILLLILFINYISDRKSANEFIKRIKYLFSNR